MKRVRESEEGYFDLFDHSFLTHVLSYAWRSYYRLALTCHRFLVITRSREYWQALACQALKEHVPPQTLHQIDWLHGLKDGEPFHFYLWALWTQRDGAFYSDKSQGGSIEFFSLEMRQINVYPSLIQIWRIKFAYKTDPIECFSTSVRRVELMDDSGFIIPKQGELWYITHWNNPLILKEISTCAADNQNNITVCYVEIPIGDKIWCGAIENPIRAPTGVGSLIPKIGFGVWK